MALDKFELNIIICKWVEKNFGMSEVENPSWDIDKLANYIAEQYGGPLEEEEAEQYELTMLVKQDDKKIKTKGV